MAGWYSIQDLEPMGWRAIGVKTKKGNELLMEFP